MTRKYPSAGLTEELYRRLVSEYNALRVKYKREFNGRIRAVRNCDVREARKYSQKFCNVITERSRLSPNTAEDLKGLISDQLFKRSEVCPLSHNCITQRTTWLVVEAEKIQLI